MSKRPPRSKKPGGGSGRPPIDTRFKPGQSGNPGGRPKKERDVLKILNEELDETVIITDHGKRMRIDKRRLVIRWLVNSAAKGSFPAIDRVLKMSGTAPPSEDQFVDLDPQQLASFIARLAKQDDEGGEE